MTTHGLRLEKVRAVLAASQLPVALSPVNLADELLLWVTSGVRTLILGGPLVLAESASAQTIMRAMEALEAAMAVFPAHIGPRPPPIPPEWKREVEQWGGEVSVRNQRGRPVRPYQNALMLLCSFYRVAFAREPGNDDPTRSFIQAWWAEFQDEMREATFRAEPSIDESRQKIMPWQKLSNDALRKALKTVKRDAMLDKQLIAELYELKRIQILRETITSNKG